MAGRIELAFIDICNTHPFPVKIIRKAEMFPPRRLHMKTQMLHAVLLSLEKGGKYCGLGLLESSNDSIP